MTIPKLEYCLLLRIGKLIPQYSRLIDLSLKKFFPGSSLNCPVKPAKFFATIVDTTGEEQPMERGKPQLETNRNGIGFELPNGKYRYTLRLHTETDPFLFFLQWQLEVKIRFNDEKF
jgi:hypothetical protein